ncbi:MAG: xanthine dehydrogenase family protein molybdopterin-binding subunit [Alphaproteobacteria bacterium]|nr:MAG: xanthine dehydrogenase family protein molybdopterin-binding subunit [Alphaproteobacteria bacterium]
MGKFTRRAFMATGGLVGGGLALGFAFAPNRLTIYTADPDSADAQLNTWVMITPDNKVVVTVPHAEMGQGSQTGLPMMLADELDADWSTVSMVQAPATEIYANSDLARGFVLGDVSLPNSIFRLLDYSLFKLSGMIGVQNTGGSSAVRYTGNMAMRSAGAAAKHMLLQAAATRWGVSASSLTASESVVTHAASNQSATYGELASEAALMEVPLQPTLKSPDQFTLIGTSQPRFDIPSKVDGSAEYGIDVEVPGMLYAAIKHAPVFGSKYQATNLSEVRASRGVMDIVELDGAIAVVADNFWRAKIALDMMELQCIGGDRQSMTSAQIYDRYAEAALSEDGSYDADIGDTAAALAQSDRIVKASYRVPFLAHAAMEPLNCTASVTKDRCDVWVGHQNPLGARAAAAVAAGMDADNVTIHNRMLGGGFGRRTPTDFVTQAVTLSRQVGAPIKLIWSREEDIQHDMYRPAVANHMSAALDADGMPTAWTNSYTNSGQNEPAESPLTQYAIPNQSIKGVDVDSAVPIGAWRSVGHTQHSFFNESFVDELAVEAGIDPYQYRRKLLADMPRHRKVLDVAAQKAGWGEPLPAGRARGIAIEQSFGSIVAEVAEVSVSDDGDVTVHKVTAVIDCGTAVNPDSVVAQIEGGIIYGLTAALYGDIEIADGCVVQTNFPDYPMVTLQQAPDIEVHIINSGEAIGGVGEPGTPPIAPAVTNAIYQITGKRIRNLPISAHDLS